MNFVRLLIFFCAIFHHKRMRGLEILTVIIIAFGQITCLSSFHYVVEDYPLKIYTKFISINI